MSKVSFFTPIHYGDQPKSLSETILEKVDHYFYLGGKRAVVINDKTNGKKLVEISEAQLSLIAKIVRVVSYLLIPLPFILLITKTVLRSIHSYHVGNAKTKLVEIQNMPPEALKRIETFAQKKIESEQNVELKIDEVTPKKLEQEPEVKIPFNAQEELEKGIVLDQQTINTIQDLLPSILAKKDNPQMKWLNKFSMEFKLPHLPHVKFCMSFAGTRDPEFGSQMTHHLFEKMVKAQEICTSNHLNLLVLPHAKKFSIHSNGHEYTFIVKEHFECNRHQDELYHRFSDDLNETVRQIAIFIAQSGFCHFTWRKMPLLNPDLPGDKRVVLEELYAMGNNAVDGFIGECNTKGWGLIKCVSDEQIDIVIAEAQKHNIHLLRKNGRSANDAKEERLEELKGSIWVRQFHKNKGFVTGREPIVVDIGTLGLDLTEKYPLKREEYSYNGLYFNGDQMLDDFPKNCDPNLQDDGRSITLRQATEDVIKCINHQLKIDEMPFHRRITPPFDYPGYFYHLGLNKKPWIDNILDALHQKGYLFSWEKNTDPECYYIQA